MACCLGVSEVHTQSSKVMPSACSRAFSASRARSIFCSAAEKTVLMLGASAQLVISLQAENRSGPRQFSQAGQPFIGISAFSHKLAKKDVRLNHGSGSRHRFSMNGCMKGTNGIW
jgi:hypothetical protein